MTLGVHGIGHKFEQLRHSATRILNCDDGCMALRLRSGEQTLGDQDNRGVGSGEVRQIFGFAQETQLAFCGLLYGSHIVDHAIFIAI